MQYVEVFAPLMKPARYKGAAAARIEGVRTLFPQIWFEAGSTEGGREALGWYHEKRDDVRRIGLSPAHDRASQEGARSG